MRNFVFKMMNLDQALVSENNKCLCLGYSRPNAVRADIRLESRCDIRLESRCGGIALWWGAACVLTGSP